MSAVHYAERGAGSLLLCLHGIGSSSASFAPQLDELSDAHRVVAWDAPGYGNSPDPGEPPGMPGYAEVAAELIKELGEPVHLLGVSWGGVIAIQVALSYPELTRSLLLVGASRGSGRSPEAAERMSEQADLLAELGPEQFAQQRAPALLSANAERALVERVAETMATAVRLPGYRYAIDAMAATDHSARLDEVTVPTLVLCGAEDTVTGAPEAQALAEGIRDAVSVSIAGAGHLANQEQPESVNAWIAAYLQIIERLYT
ncbi:MAG: alpha/beta fold hydrolase [Actinophytocola sp.]|nr:alpha/beta fold hydrolase [Actinophytocola sp.]